MSAVIPHCFCNDTSIESEWSTSFLLFFFLVEKKTSSRPTGVTYMYVCMYVCMYVYIYIYIYNI